MQLTQHNFIFSGYPKTNPPHQTPRSFPPLPAFNLKAYFWSKHDGP